MQRVCVSVLVSVYIIRVHYPLHLALVYMLWSCKKFKGSKATLKYYMRINGNCIKLAKERNENDAMLALWMRHEIRWLVDKI